MRLLPYPNLLMLNVNELCRTNLPVISVHAYDCTCTYCIIIFYITHRKQSKNSIIYN